MPVELELYGVYVPTFIVLMLVAYIVNQILRPILQSVGVYRLVWHRALFDVSLYILILGALFFLSRRLAS